MISSRSAPRAVGDGETFATGRFRFRFLQTPQMPHGWDAALLFEETQSVLFCSDLLHQNGDVGRFHQTLVDNRDGPTPGYLPYTPRTGAMLKRLGELRPKVLAAMHGSAYLGDGEQALADAAAMMREVLARSIESTGGAGYRSASNPARFVAIRLSAPVHEVVAKLVARSRFGLDQPQRDRATLEFYSSSTAFACAAATKLIFEETP